MVPPSEIASYEPALIALHITYTYNAVSYMYVGNMLQKYFISLSSIAQS